MKTPCLLPWLACWACLLPGLQPASAAPKPLMVYYMPWFTAKPAATNWGWHWTMDRFNPDLTNAIGQRQIASWYYPLIGPYDSSDDAVLEYHVLLMKLSGIDGVIVDWYGATDFLDYGGNNRAAARLFEYVRRAGLKFAVCYEDQTIQHLIAAGDLTPAQAVPRARQDMLYLQRHWFGDAAYLRYRGRPVLLNFGPQYFTRPAGWPAIFSALEPSNRPAFFNEDNRLPASLGAFNWPPMWLSQSPGTGGVLSEAALKSYLSAFEAKAAAWPAFISSAFPRFHDVYQDQTGRGNLGYLGDHHGETFRETLARGLTNSSALVQIVAWNDFGEGSMVEPTEEYGYRDLSVIQDYRRQFVDPGFNGQSNDLTLPLQLYQLRREISGRASDAAGLDEIFTNLAAGRLAAARSQIRELSQTGSHSDSHTAGAQAR